MPHAFPTATLSAFPRHRSSYHHGLLTMSSENDWGPASINITQVGDFKKAPYKYKLTPLPLVAPIVKLGAGVGRIW